MIPPKLPPLSRQKKPWVAITISGVGASAAEAIIAALAAGRLAEVKRVLDLPCGHGRVLRHLVNMFPDAAV